MKRLLLVTTFFFPISGLTSSLEYLCTYQRTIQSNPYDLRVYTEKNPKLLNYKQKIMINLEKRTVSRVYSYLQQTGEKNIETIKEIVSPISNVSRDLTVPNKLVYWYEETQGKKGIHDGQVSIFSLATWTKTTLTRSYISVISAYDVHYDCHEIN